MNAGVHFNTALKRGRSGLRFAKPKSSTERDLHQTNQLLIDLFLMQKKENE